MTTQKPNVLIDRIAVVILGAGGALCALLVLYLTYRFADKNTTADCLLIFLALAACLATMLLAGLRLQSHHKVGLCLFFLSAGVSIYAAEIFLVTSTFQAPAEWFAYKSMKEKQVIAKQFGVDFDARTKLELIADLAQAGIDAHPYASASILLQREPDGTVRSPIVVGGAEVVPLGGISNAVTILCNETGAYVTYNSDEYGFNNPQGIWDRRVTIAALGDSFTHGSCVPRDKNFVALIRNRYASTVNLGGGGQGPLLMLGTLKEYVKHLRPSLVLWFYFEGNDLENLKYEKRNPLLVRYLTESFSQNLRDRQSDIDHALMAYIETAKEEISNEELKRHGYFPRSDTLRRNFFPILTLAHLRGRLGAIYEQYSADSASDDGNGSDPENALLYLFRVILLNAKTSAEGWGGKLYFVYLPQWERYSKPALANKDRERVLSITREMGIPIIDIHEAFRAQEDPLELFPFNENAHYNETGNRVVAEAVLRVISLDPSLTGMRKARVSVAP